MNFKGKVRKSGNSFIVTIPKALIPNLNITKELNFEVKESE